MGKFFMDKKELINIIEPILVNWLGNLLVYPAIERIAELIADKIKTKEGVK